MGYSFEGRRKLETYEGRKFTSKLDRFDQDEIENLGVGDRFVYLADERMFQNAYEITKVIKTEKRICGRNEETGEYEYDIKEYKPKNQKIVCTRLTKTGKVTSQRNRLSDHFQMNRGSLTYSIRKYYDGVGYDIEEYKENTKRWVPTGKRRDTQRKQVYRSEWSLHRDDIYGQIFDSKYEAQQYIDDLLEDDFVNQVWPDLNKREISVKWNNRLKNKARACYHEREIQISKRSRRKWALSELTMVHEFAHFCAEDDLAGHGPVFTTAFLKLLRYINEEIYELLREQYDMRNIDYNADELEQTEKIAA